MERQYNFVEEDSIPPPTKKQRKSSSSDSDFYDAHLSNKSKVESLKKDEATTSADNEQPSTSTAASTSEAKDTEHVQTNECADGSEQAQDEEMSEDKKPAAENKPPEHSSPASLSNSSASTGSSPDSTLPINTSTAHELSLEKDLERKLLRKIEYHLMDIFQHLNGNETDTSNASDNNTSQKLNESSELGPSQ